jgi:hypothetical protein
MLIMPAFARPAEEKAAKSNKPAVILRIAPFDKLMADARYLVEMAGQAEMAKQLDATIKSKIGDKGLEGIDPKKALGAYGWIGPAGIDSQIIALVPIADKKAFLDLLDRLSVKVEEGQDGLYTASHEKLLVPVYFRFANQYVYITAQDKDALAKEKLLAPAAVLPDDATGAVAMTVNVDQVPENLKELALGNLDNHLAAAKEKEVPNETDLQKKFRTALIDEMGKHIKSLLKDGGEVKMRLGVDAKAADLSLSMSVAGKAGSPLATSIKDLGQMRTLGASVIGPNSAMNGVLNLSLPAKLRELLGPVIEEGEKKAVEKEKDKSKRDALAALLKALEPTLKNAELDVAADLRGPGDNGLYSAVASIKVKDGAAVEKTIRQVIGNLPADQRKAIAFDVEKVGSVGIHRVTPDKTDEQSKQVFGDNPTVYFAVREDAMLVALGEKGLGALKEALGGEAKSSKVMEIQMAMSRLAPLMAKDNKSAPEIAKEVFGKAKEGDKIHITVEGGDALKLRLGMKAQLLEFFYKLQQAKKQGE